MATQQSAKEYAEKYHRQFELRMKFFYKPILFPMMTIVSVALLVLIFLGVSGRLPS